MCDANQCFGVEVMGLAAGLTTVRYGILKLSNVVLKYERDLQEATLVESSDRTADESVTHEVLLGTFSSLEDVLTNLADFWLQGETSGQRRTLLEAVLPELDEGSSLASSVYWLLVRLGKQAVSFHMVSLIQVRAQLRAHDCDTYQNPIALYCRPIVPIGEQQQYSKVCTGCDCAVC
jgi:hypothetical protein